MTTLTAEQLHRDTLLRELVAHAVEKSPYYREAFGADALNGELELEQLPTLPKATFMREFDRIVTDPQLRLADLEAHLAGPDAGTPFRGRYRAFASSGSSGLRGVFVYSEEEFATWVAAHLPVFGRIGIGPSTRLAPIGAPSPIHLSKQLFAAFGQGRSAPPRLSVLTPLREICDALESFRPDAVIGYASVIAALAQEQLDGRVRIAPRIVATGAELLTAEMEQRVVDAWGVRPVQIYATTEAPIVAASAPGQRELRVLADLIWIEVVDEHNRPVPAGTPGHKVLLTNLVNHAQPLIRYELTDSVTLAAPDVIASIDGRSDDILLLPGKDGGQVAVHPVRLRAPFARLPEVALYQLVHDGRELRVRIVPRPGAPPDLAEHVREAMRAALDGAGVASSAALRVETVQAIEREGHAAKLKLVKRARVS
jgi:phenylacetate-coenzyme A ligase PaaK-like adenylate-forming protein